MAQSIKQEVSNIQLNARIHDDGIFAGEKEDFVRALEILTEEGPARGMILSTKLTSPRDSKSAVVWCPHGLRSL